MNHLYRTLFNRRAGAWRTVPEFAKSQSQLHPLALALALAAAPAGAQQVIGGTDTEIVDGSGDGTSGTQDSPWNIGEALTVNAELIIQNGGTVSNTHGYIGANIAATGTVTVTGEGSGWANSNDLAIGFYGSGTLNIEDGGTVSASELVLGRYGGSSGTLFLSGAETGRGVLETGFVQKRDGSASFTFDGGILRAPGNQADFLRHFGAGDVTIAAGGAFIDSNGFDIGIATDLQGNGDLTKLGAGTLTLAGANSYSGGTTIDQGTLRAGAEGAIQGDYVIGDAGTLDIDTQSVTLTSLSGSGVVGFGRTGSPTLILEQDEDTVFAGRFAMNNLFSISQNRLIKQGTGTLTLTGDSSLLPTDGSASLLVQGGTLTVKQGGSLRYNGYTRVDGGALLRVSGDGTEWSGRTLYLGQDGNGELWIGDGAEARTSNPAYIGYGEDSEGHATLIGGATWNQQGNLFVGQSGAVGRLIIEQGSEMTTGTGAIGHGGIGEVTVDDALWTVDDFLRVGDGGEGYLTVREGAEVQAAQANTAIGYGQDARGRVTVTGAGSLLQTRQLAIGHDSSGELQIADGGRLRSATTQVGNTATGQGGVTVRGDGSLWTVSGGLTVGRQGQGTLTLADGGALESFSNITLAEQADSEGTLRIGDGGGAGSLSLLTQNPTIRFGDGDGTLVFNHTDTGYQFDAALDSIDEGNGTLLHQAGDTLLTGDSSGFDGTATVTGGILRVNGELGGTLTVENGAALGGNGSVGSTTVNSGGTLAPGNSLGHLTVDGDLTLAQGSLLDFEFGAPGGDFHTLGQSDSVTVNGDLTLNGSTLNLIDNGGFGVGLYRLFDYSGTLTQSHDGTALAGEPEGAQLQFLDDQGQINLLNTAGMTLNVWSGDNADGGDGVWSNGTASWTDVDGRVVAPMQPQPGFALFGNIGNGEGGTVTLDDTDGDVQATGLQFAGDGYVLQGDTLTLTEGDGEIRVGDGSGDSAGYTATLNGVIAGTDGVNKTGAGTLVLGGDNIYGGGTTLNGGILSVSRDANLGNTDGGLAFNGGVLRVTDGQFLSTQRSITWGDQGGGFDIVASSQQFIVNQDLQGAGDLIKRGEGILHLRGANDYGNTLVEAGRLFGTATSISGDLANAGNVVFAQDTDGTFTGNIGGFNGTDGTLIKNGGGVLTLTGTSTLDWSVHDGALVTAAERFSGDLAVLADGGVTFDQQQDGEYQGQLSGTGTVRKTGNGQLRLNGGNGGFDGTTEVAAGRLSVGGRLGGTVRVGDGGTLGGDGIVGDTTIASGGTLAPGNSIGTLTVDGDLTFENGAVYEVETDPDNTDSDLTHVTGTASLSGSVLHVGNDGEYQPFTEYTILSADGGILGQFEAVRSRFAFLDAGLDYGNNDVRLALTRNDIRFDSVALTRNQRSVAGAVETLAPDHAVYQDIVTQETDAAPAAFDRYSGDTLVAGLSASDRLIGQFGERLRQRDQGDSAPKAQRTLAGDAANGVWLQAGALDSEEQRNGYTGNASYEMTGEHLTLGLDRTLPRGRAGVAVGRAQGRLDFDRRRAEGDLDGWFVGAYGRRDLTDTLYVRADLSYGETDQDHKRTFESGTWARSSSTIKATRVALESGFDLTAGPHQVRPYAQVAWTRLERDGFHETGAGAANLDVMDTTSERGEAELGVDLGRTLRSGRHPTRLHGGLALVQPFGDTQSEQKARFVDAGDTFTVYGADRDDPRWQARLGAAVRLSPRVEVSLDYQGRVGEQGDEHLGQAGISLRW